ncbi:MAG: hypothetical protein IJW45_08960 [Oscillospiraceae bacterium]|nr:hypothetical protein [Oscillospiraceae bacterium]
MAQERIKKLHLIYGCILSLLLIAVAIALIVSCLHIYNSGDRPYSPTSISAHFQSVSLLVYAAIAAVIGGIALHLILPLPADRPKGVKDDLAMLRHQQERAGSLTGAYAQGAERKQKERRLSKCICCILFVLLMIMPSLYFMDTDHFSVADLNEDVIRALIYSLVPAIFGLILSYFCKLFCQQSIRQEIDIWKEAIKEGCVSPTPQTSASVPDRRIFYARTIIGIIALVFIIVGVFNGGAMDVLLKAIAICTECIGLG